MCVFIVCLPSREHGLQNGGLLPILCVPKHGTLLLPKCILETLNGRRVIAGATGSRLASRGERRNPHKCPRFQGLSEGSRGGALVLPVALAELSLYMPFGKDCLSGSCGQISEYTASALHQLVCSTGKLLIEVCSGPRSPTASDKQVSSTGDV